MSKDTINHREASHISKEEALEFCHKNRNIFIGLAESVEDGTSEFNEIIAGLESGEITPGELPDYCMSDQELR